MDETEAMKRDQDSFILDLELLAGELYLNDETMNITLPTRYMLPTLLAQYVETQDFERTTNKAGLSGSTIASSRP